MSPRPRKVTDPEVFAATQRAMSRLGPADLTLAAIADEAGVTASALVQRFGSKRGFMLALWETYAPGSEDLVVQLEAAHDSPLAALRAYADCLAGLAVSPDAVARNLAYLQIDLTAPEFRPYLVAQARGNRAGVERLVRAAIRKGELKRGTNAAALARTVDTALNGSLFSWAVYQDGTAAHWMRRDLEAVLAPHRTGRRT